MGITLRRAALTAVAGVSALAVGAAPAFAQDAADEATAIAPKYNGQAPSVVGGQAFRVSGIDRYEVSVNAAKQAIKDGVAGEGKTLILASGVVWPDAVTATPLSAAYKAPVVLTKGGALPPVVSAFIKAQQPTRVVVSGGPGTINDSVIAQVKELVDGVKVERNGGADRYEVAYNNAAEAAAALKNDGSIKAAHDQLQSDTEAEAEYQEAKKVYDEAHAAVGVAQDEFDAAVAKVLELNNQLKTEADKIQHAEPGDVEALKTALTNLNAALKEQADAKKAQTFVSVVLGSLAKENATTLDTSSTLGDYREILTEDQVEELDAAEKTLGVTDSTTLNDAVATANLAVDNAANDVTTKAQVVGEAQKKIDDAAKVDAANAPILKKMGEIKGQINDASEAAKEAAKAVNAAKQAEAEASVRLAVATKLRPAVGFDKRDLAALTAARDAAVRNANTPAFLATGRIYTDALTTGPAAVNTDSVVLLTKGATMGTWAQKWASLSNSQLVSVGGDAINAAGDTATVQVPGADRYEVSVNLAKKFFKGKVYPSVTSGQIFSDATSGGSFSALYKNPLLLTYGNKVPFSVDNFIRNANSPEVSQVVVLGGPATVLPETVSSLNAAVARK